MWVRCNPNPLGKAANDCVVRAIAVTMERSWQNVYQDLCREGRRDQRTVVCFVPRTQPHIRQNEPGEKRT